ncbi:MAG: hypothetical protein JKX76_04235 [Colwellia sp.]|nr:hypothetical protein [Colwellia sp.]
MIPEFDKDGNLPAGIHDATLKELIDRFGYNPKRAWLIDGLNLLIENLRKAGCNLIYIDGSFVTNKEIPGDYDLCWSMQAVEPSRIDPLLLEFSPETRNKVEVKYRGDIFPAEIPEGASGKLFVDFFQTDKNTGKDKGIIAINIGDVK